MEEIMSVFGSAHILGIKEIAGALIMSFVLCGAITAVYRKTFQGLSYSRSFTPIPSTPPLTTFTAEIEGAESVLFQLRVDDE